MRLHDITAAHDFNKAMHNGDDGQFPKSLEVGEVCTPRPGHLQQFIGTTCGASFWNELNFGPSIKTQTVGRGLKGSAGLCNSTSF